MFSHADACPPSPCLAARHAARELFVWVESAYSGWGGGVWGMAGAKRVAIMAPYLSAGCRLATPPLLQKQNESWVVLVGHTNNKQNVVNEQ